MPADYTVNLNASTQTTSDIITIDPGWFGLDVRFGAGVTGTVQLQRRMPGETNWYDVAKGDYTKSGGGVGMSAGGQWQYRFAATAALSGAVQCIIRQSLHDRFGAPSV